MNLQRRTSAALVASALNDVPALVPGTLGAWTVELLDAARRSAISGGQARSVSADATT